MASKTRTLQVFVGMDHHQDAMLSADPDTAGNMFADPLSLHSTSAVKVTASHQSSQQTVMQQIEKARSAGLNGASAATSTLPVAQMGAPPPCSVPNLFHREYFGSRPARWWLLARWSPGVKVPEFLACVVVGLVLIFAVPRPEELTAQSWGLFGVFVATICGLILRPLPMGGISVVAVSVILWSGLLTFPEAFDAFTDRTVWLIVSALLMAEAVEKTGLGCRLSLLFISAVGGTPLGLTYALMGADLVLAMGMPSTTAREGGVFLSILRGICQAYGSYPDDYTSSKLLGSFLMMSQLQHTQPTSAMWLTGAAPNSLAIGLAHKQGVQLPASDWVVWVMGACIPALVIMSITPLLVLWLYPPKIKKTPEAPAHAKRALARMGPLTYGEAGTLAIMTFAIAFWVAGGYIKAMPQLSTTAVALMALALMLMSGVLTWEGCLGCTFAWDILFWIGILMSMSNALTHKGVMDWFARHTSQSLLSTGMPVVGIWILLLMAYVAMHYLFASQSAHIAALYTPFLSVMIQCGISPVLSAMSLAYVGNTFTGMTHYASAESVIYFSSKYYSVRAVFGVGFVMTLFNLALWIGLGLGWWRAVGFYSDMNTMQ